MIDDWRRYASCKGMTDLFFPVTDSERNGRRSNSAYAAAREICATCPVRVPCAEAVAALPGPWAAHGMWGGRTPHERKVHEAMVRVKERE